ncbi:regulating synaptic membrane exocytosis protein 2-like [Antedon mediterranea]|uniref:regulating synaptic membrane exocytosis protein 2-like n=1 Tax=Antedon mediterranea TaxID=105859 RepID=UPI003AF8E9D6
MPITGEIRLSVLYKAADRELVVHTQEAKGIQVRHTTGDPQLPNPYIKIDMLPHRRESIRQRTATVDASLCPVWNKVFVYSNIDENNIDTFGLEFTLWDDIPKRSNTFMGEVLLDLADCDLNGHSQWYNLVDHDENSGPLPKSSPAEVRKTSPCFTRGLPSMPAHDKVKELWENGYLTLRSQGNRSGSDTSICSARSADEHWPYDRSSFTSSTLLPSPTVVKQLTGSKPKIKVLGADSVHESHAGATAAGCLFRPRSSTLPISSLRRSASDRQPTVKSQAKTILRATNSDASLNIQTKSKGIFRRCASFRRADSTSSDRSRGSITSLGSTDSENFIKLLSQTFEDNSLTMQDDEPSGTPEGPGQAKLQNNGMRVCGYIMIDMTVSKGFLEVLIIKVHGLNGSQSEPIDTYVKTYLRDFKKKLQKKKTRVVKKSTNPVYMQKLTYSACDIDRRILQVGVWKKGSGIESNKQLGETRIHLDKCSLDHMEHTKAWYTLYPSLAFARSDSVESQASI